MNFSRSHYPERNTETMLRSVIQSLKNIRFIFSGIGWPFYGSFRLMEFDPISHDAKEMIYQERDEKGTYYQVYDCFLSR